MKAKSMPTSKAPPKTSKNATKPRKTQQIQLNSPEFRKLQRQWYAKADKAGFKDLEKFIGEDQQPADLLHGPSLRNAADMFNPEKRHYYRQWSCFLAHMAETLSSRDRLIAELYAEGTKYRNIIERVNKRFRAQTISLNPLHFKIKQLYALIKAWNETDSRGLDFSADIGE
jgi:hypothetical protein